MASLKWYINRAKIMNTKEIIHRIRCGIYDKKIEYGYRIKEEKYKINFIEINEFKGEVKENKTFLEECQDILNNEIEIFNMKINLNYEKKFLRDPFSKKLWSNEIYTKVSFRKDNLPGDPKIIWEINKQQYLVDLALAYHITKEPKYADKILNEINEWINQNQEYMGINWTSGLEISLRCLSWIFSLSLIREYIVSKNICINKIVHYIRVKTELIFNKLSLYSSANNHLIGELTLLLYSSYFIECEDSAVWRKEAISMLNDQIKNQFYKDGVNKEQSINYQIHTMELYFLCQYLLKLNNMSLKSNTLEILKRACFYLDKLSESDGTVFNIGDEDGGHILKVQNQCNSILNILQFGLLILGDNNIYGKKNKVIDYKILMLFGKKYLEFINEVNISTHENMNVYLFEDGGMYVRNGNLDDITYKAMFDFGEIGMKPLNAHAHSDILSFNLNINGKPFLIDSGTYKYHKDDGFRDYFRGVSAHNTISIDDKNQFEFLGPFMCEKSPKTILNKIDDNSIKCTSNMYKSKGCSISRKLLFSNKEIKIVDFIENNSTNDIEVKVYFNFDSNIKLKKMSNKYIYDLEKNNIIVEIDKECKNDLIRGYNEKYKLGWQSYEFYQLNQTNTIVCSKTINSNCYDKIITKIYLGMDISDKNMYSCK